VHFGALEREQLPAEYRAADVMVFPSTWPEPFGLVPIEAMACGVPVVATGVGGSAEFLVHGENCLLVEPGDPVALAAAVRRLAGDPALRRTLVAHGLETARELDVERLADVMEAWHRYEASGAHGTPPAPRPSPGQSRQR
jgi:glycosyltransferase involved in cell wall biosynthesis